MTLRKQPCWSAAEVEVLRTVYVAQGLDAALALLPGRSRQATYVHASKLGLKTLHRPCPRGKFPERITAAMRLRAQGLSYARIGAELGVCESTATNAVLAGECLALGHRPIERDCNGKFLPEGRERLRMMLRKGMKHRDIQVRLGLAASTITRERRMYEADLRARRMVPLPPPGGGERYSGVRVPAATRRRVEALYREGYGAQKVSLATGVSRTHCLRIRARLIARLRRRGECLPGCDRDGRRTKVRDSTHFIPPHSWAMLRELLLGGMPVRRAARLAIIGESSAYRYFHRLKAELAAEGKEVPRAEWRGKGRQRRAYAVAPPVPGGRLGFERYRALCRDMPPDQARAKIAADAAAAARAEREASRPRTFEEQLAAVRRGDLGVVEAPRITRVAA